MNTLHCRICGRGEADSLGRIPDSEEFAGQKLSSPIKGGELWQCKECGSMFRYPTLSSSDYISLYEKLPSTVWIGGEIWRNDTKTIYTYLNSHTGGSILDIGCFSGAFLAGLSERFTKYGVEPSDSASRFAASNGINVLGKTLSDLNEKLKFDVVTSIDVVEHLLDVEEFLMQAMSHVKDNGLLIIASGDPDAGYWKFLYKSRYWYSLFPEHVSFPSYKFFCNYSENNKLPLPERIRFIYMNLKKSDQFSKFIDQFLFFLSPAIYRYFKKIFCTKKQRSLPIQNTTSVLAAGVFLDQHIIIFRKSEPQFRQ